MAVGIIAEYNPFHNGHKYHIEKTKEICSSPVVAIISPNFVQRGEPAICDKHTRAEMALKNGVDIVIELPVEYATASADVFAKGAISILNATSIVDKLSFGSEIGDIEIFNKTAEILCNEPVEYKAMLKGELKKGVTYPLARKRALEIYSGDDLSFMEMPNNILGIEYIRQIKEINSNITPITVERQGSGYNDRVLNGVFSSASAIREAIAKNDRNFIEAIPQNCIDELLGKECPSIDDYSNIISYILSTAKREDISKIADITEGLENKIMTTEFATATELIDKVKSKRYTRTKLQRAILHILLGITKEHQLEPPKYIRVLGFRRDKRNLLSEMVKKATLPVIINVKENENLLKKEIVATDIYNITRGNKKGVEYTTPIKIV